jgi:hypothetical protein
VAFRTLPDDDCPQAKCPRFPRLSPGKSQGERVRGVAALDFLCEAVVKTRLAFLLPCLIRRDTDDKPLIIIVIRARTGR